MGVGDFFLFDEGALIERYVETMRLNFAGSEFEFLFERKIVPELAEVQWAPIPDRAVLGSLNEMILMARYGMDKSPVEISQWLAQTPMKVLGGNLPARVFPKLGG